MGIAERLGLKSTGFERLSNRARVPLMLRDLVNQGTEEVTLTMSAATALAMADDIEFAVQAHPFGVCKNPSDQSES